MCVAQAERRSDTGNMYTGREQQQNGKKEMCTLYLFWGERVNASESNKEQEAIQIHI